MILESYDEVVLMGDSAGGGLCLSLALKLLKHKISCPEKIVLISPWVDISMTNPEIKNYEKVDPLLSSYGLKEFGKLWANGLSSKNYLVSPIYGKLNDLKNIYIFVGNREILYPDIRKLFAELQVLGVNVELYVKNGMNHAYPLYPIPEAKQAFRIIQNIVK